MIHQVTPGSFSPSMKTGKTPEISNRKGPSIEKLNSTLDSFGLGEISTDELTAFGKVPIILKSDNKDTIHKLKEELVKKFKPDQASVKMELDLVDSIKIDVDPYNLKKLLEILPDDVQALMDNKIIFQKPKKPESSVSESAEKEKPVLDIANSTLGINRLWDMGYTGKGVGICVIDSGIYPHPDIKDKIVAFVDMADGNNTPHDPYGHGTHLAGIGAGTGVASNGKFKGVAPDAHLVGVRITSVSEAIRGIQWAIENKDKYGIKIINMSLGDIPISSYKEDPWAQAAEKAWESGLVVVVAAGNEGPNNGTVSTPGIAPSVITVGAIDDKNTPQRDDDKIAKFSSVGPTLKDNLDKPDIVAPGVEIYGPLSPGSTLDTPDMPHEGTNYIAISGSSQATMIVSGVTALLIEANRDLSNNEIKKIYMETADDYIPKATKHQQGAGLIDPLESMHVALNMKNSETGLEDLPKKEVVPMLIADTGNTKKKRAKKNLA